MAHRSLTLSDLRKRLLQRDFKLTRPRQKIVEKILSARAGEHFSADQLWEGFRRRREAISKATVYRTLNLLVEEKVVEEHDFGKGQKYYERMVERPHHDHLICIHCGRIIEFENPRIERLQEVVAKQEGFAISYHSHKIFGACSHCRRRAKASRPIHP